MGVCRWLHHTFRKVRAFPLAACVSLALAASGVTSTLAAQTPRGCADPPVAPAGEITYVYDTTHVTMWGEPEKGRFFRRVYLVMFKYEAACDSIGATLRGMNAKIEPGYMGIGHCIVTIPDPGPAATDIDRILAGFRRFSAVKYVTPWPADQKRILEVGPPMKKPSSM